MACIIPLSASSARPLSYLLPGTLHSSLPHTCHFTFHHFPYHSLTRHFCSSAKSVTLFSSVTLPPPSMTLHVTPITPVRRHTPASRLPVVHVTRKTFRESLPLLAFLPVDVSHDVFANRLVIIVEFHRLDDHGALVRPELVVVEPQLQGREDVRGFRGCWLERGGGGAMLYKLRVFFDEKIKEDFCLDTNVSQN